MLKRNSIKVHSNTRPHWQLALEREPAGRMGDFRKFLNGFDKSPRLIVLDIEGVQFALQNCEILHSVKGLYDKNSASWYCFTSDVMYKKYKGLVYTPSDLLARICKVNLSNAKKFGLICFPRICFRGLIYCDLECAPRCLLFFGCTYKVINSM